MYLPGDTKSTFCNNWKRFDLHVTLERCETKKVSLLVKLSILLSTAVFHYSSMDKKPERERQTRRVKGEGKI